MHRCSLRRKSPNALHLGASNLDAATSWWNQDNSHGHFLEIAAYRAVNTQGSRTIRCEFGKEYATVRHENFIDASAQLFCSMVSAGTARLASTVKRRSHDVCAV